MPRAGAYVFRVQLWPQVYRDVEIDRRKSPYDLAAALVRAFGFDFDHAFGFFSKLTGHIYDSPVRGTNSSLIWTICPSRRRAKIASREA